MAETHAVETGRAERRTRGAARTTGAARTRGAGAAVAVGSTSVHFTAAAVTARGLRRLADESVLLELGSAMDVHGDIPAPTVGQLIATLQRFTTLAAELGVGDVTFVGTEPLRRAANGPAVAATVRAATGRPLHLLTHEEEALLSLYGVLRGRLPALDTLVVDIGGGSSEYVLARREGPPAIHVVRTGAARLTEAVVRHDPPTRDEFAALRAEARRRLAAAAEMHPRRAVLVGGTATNLLRVVAEGRALRTLNRRRLALAVGALEREPAAALAQRCALRPQRARILAGGAALVEAFLERYGLSSAVVSQASIREGTILAVARAGDAWREQLAGLVASG
jgi:exopolyphosphatase/guanosine-5'-triphosphate,3'-diphosphate pyrophosphatase